jgi:hypothetical protein
VLGRGLSLFLKINHRLLEALRSSIFEIPCKCGVSLSETTLCVLTHGITSSQDKRHNFKNISISGTLKYGEKSSS